MRHWTAFAILAMFMSRDTYKACIIVYLLIQLDKYATILCRKQNGWFSRCSPDQFCFLPCSVLIDGPWGSFLHNLFPWQSLKYWGSVWGGGVAYQDEKLIALTTHSDTQVLFWVLILNSWFSCWRFGSYAHWKYVKYVVQFHPFKYFSCVAGKHVLTNDHSPNSVFIWGKLFPKTQQRLRCKVEQRCSGLNLSNWPRRASFFSHSLEQKL